MESLDFLCQGILSLICRNRKLLKINLVDTHDYINFPERQICNNKHNCSESGETGVAKAFKSLLN